MIINNQRRQVKGVPDKFKTTRVGVLPKINEDLQPPIIRGNINISNTQTNNLNRTMFGN